MIDLEVDVLIVGGGIIGTALLRALNPLNLTVKLIDNKPLSTHTSFDARSIALSNSSIQILKTLGVWSLLENAFTPIEHIHVSEKGSFGHAHLEGEPGQALGAVVELSELMNAFQPLINEEDYLVPAELLHYDIETQIAQVKKGGRELSIHSRWIIGADGADSFLRQCCHLPVITKDYEQCALVANIGLKRSHHRWAYERFTVDGPIAMLPLSEQRASLIWVNSLQKTQQLMQMSDSVFLQTLQRQFGFRLGVLEKVGLRTLYPLYQKIMPQKILSSVIFMGNAAHTLHPIAGQGFNLGLRDVAMLAQCIVEHGLTSAALTQYQQLRRVDEQVVTTFTDRLIQLFGLKVPGFSFARGIGLATLDNSAFLKKMVARYAGGYGGIIPDLACGISLNIGSKSHN